MRVFITGGTGYIGSAFTRELLDVGHQVIGLARSDTAASALKAAGAQVQQGTLDDLDSLRKAAAAADGVVHLAFKHEAMRAGDYAGAAEADLRAVRAFGDALVDTGKPLVIASGTSLLAFARLGRVGTESDALPGGPRIDSENAAIALVGCG